MGNTPDTRGKQPEPSTTEILRHLDTFLIEGMTFQECADRCSYDDRLDAQALSHLQGLYTDAIVAWLLRQQGVGTR